MWADPVVWMDVATKAGMKNKPNAATALVKPNATDASISPALIAASCAAWSFPATERACSFRKTAGTMWNTDPFPIPAVMNNSMKAMKNPETSLPPVSEGRVLSTHIPARNITAKFQNVTLAPPIRSDIQPPSGRIRAPASGPINAHFSAPDSGNNTAIRMGKAAANPMKEPKVPV